jgi:hypothetical protein
MKTNPPRKSGRFVALVSVLLTVGSLSVQNSGLLSVPRVCGDGQETHGKGTKTRVMLIAGDGQETHGKGGRRA